VDTPIAELGFAGVGVGAAMDGLRPIVEVMTWNFALLAMDQIVNSAAKMRQMTGGQLSAPVVFRGPQGAAHQLAAQHSQVFEAMYAQVPGLKVAVPATPRDAKGLLKTAVRMDDPVVFMESEVLYGSKGEVEEGELLIPFGEAEIVRPGRDVTVVAWQKMRFVALSAAQELAKEGIEAEVIDPRTLRPFDLEAVLASVRRTNRCVVVEEGWPWMGSGAQIADSVQRHAFDELDAPVARVTGCDVPMPYAKPLENVVLPSVERVKKAVLEVTYRA
jgi:pyruvate dehydrogenase E1 component beta subunit